MCAERRRGSVGLLLSLSLLLCCSCRGGNAIVIMNRILGGNLETGVSQHYLVLFVPLQHGLGIRLLSLLMLLVLLLLFRFLDGDLIPVRGDELVDVAKSNVDQWVALGSAPVALTLDPLSQVTIPLRVERIGDLGHETVELQLEGITNHLVHEEKNVGGLDNSTLVHFDFVRDSAVSDRLVVPPAHLVQVGLGGELLGHDDPFVLLLFIKKPQHFHLFHFDLVIDRFIDIANKITVPGNPCPVNFPLAAPLPLPLAHGTSSSSPFRGCAEATIINQQGGRHPAPEGSRVIVWCDGPEQSRGGNK